MQKKSVSESGFLNLRTITGCAFFFAATLMVYFGFAAPPSNANAVSASSWQTKVDATVLNAAGLAETEFLIYMKQQADLSGSSALTTKGEGPICLPAIDHDGGVDAGERKADPDAARRAVPIVQDPVLELRNSSGDLVTSNDNWKDSAERAQIEATGIAPSHDNESAILRNLAPGAYTAVLKGKDNSTGLALVEVYDLGLSVNSLLANISSRSFVETADNVLIGGFIAGNHPANTAILVRALGPSLKNQLPNAIDDPLLELRDANGGAITSNDNWKDSPERTQIEGTGVQPSNDLESAI